MLIAQHTVETTATAEDIWKLYEDHSTWPNWDQDIEYSLLKGSFKQGTIGVLKPKGGPEVKFVVSECVPNYKFVDISFLPLTKLVFTHILEPLNDRVAVTHKNRNERCVSSLIFCNIGS